VVARNDEITLAEIEKFSSIILSPGPGLPSEAGIMPDLLKEYLTIKPILGICLGHQAIGEALGGSLLHSGTVYHGIEKEVRVTSGEDEIFRDIPGVFNAGRYHSWLLDQGTLPRELNITAVDEEGNIMAVGHQYLPVKGIQFHPESIMTPFGEKLLYNWFCYADKFRNT